MGRVYEPAAGRYASRVPPPRIAVLASGRGSNLSALLDAHRRGDLPAPIVLVVSNNSGAGALQLARDAGIPALHISSRTDADPAAALDRALQIHRVDVVALAGYLKQLAPGTIARYAGRIVNIHPAPLPQFGGKGMFGRAVHEAVLASGVETSGPTVHEVTANYDEGPIVAHRPVPVEPGDTAEDLAARVLAAEHDLYWRVIRDRYCDEGAGP